MPQLSMVIPTFNEAQNLPVLFERLTKALDAWGGTYELVIVDDDSPDKTWLAAEHSRAQYPQVRVIRRMTGEKGLAPAVVEGWRQAKGEILGVLDADLQHPPELLPKLAELFRNGSTVDIAIASRYLPAGWHLKWNPIRKWISRGASNLAQAVLPRQAQHITDPMSGCFLLRRSVIESSALHPQGYKILLEVLGRGDYRQVAEVPYQFGRRRHGHSKLGARVMGDYLSQLWQLIWKPAGFGRFVRYCLVGASGVAINLGIVWLLRHEETLGKLRSPAVGIEFAILNNFLWNELWTFRDRASVAARLRDRIKRLISFNIICAISAALHLTIVWLLAIQLGWWYMGTNLLAIIIVTVWNYGFNLAWTWTRIVPSAEGARGLAV